MPVVFLCVPIINSKRYYKIKTIINMSNINYVYEKDPKKFKDAKKIWAGIHDNQNIAGLHLGKILRV